MTKIPQPEYILIELQKSTFGYIAIESKNSRDARKVIEIMDKLGTLENKMEFPADTQEITVYNTNQLENTLRDYKEYIENPLNEHIEEIDRIKMKYERLKNISKISRAEVASILKSNNNNSQTNTDAIGIIPNYPFATYDDDVDTPHSF